MIEQGKNVRGLGGLGIAVVLALMTALPLSVKRAVAEPPPAPAKQPADAAARSAPATLPTADPDDLLFAAMQEGQAKAWYHLIRKFPGPGLHVDKVAFSDVVDFLRDTSGIRVEVDWPGLGALGVKRDTPVTVDIHNVKFHKAFAIVLETVGGGRGKVVYTIDKDNLLILPADAVPVVLQTYDVKDLIAGDPDFGPKLIAHLTETIDPSSWQEHNGKKGMIKLEGNTLYVAQTPENQRRVVNTLILIRDQRQELRARGTRDN